MERKFILIVVLLSMLLRVSAAQDLVWEDISRGNSNFQAVMVSRADSNIIFAGLSGNVLKSEDSGKNWRSVLIIRGQARNINAISTDSINSNIIYVASDNGLYRSNNLGKHWQRIFKGRNSLEDQCNDVLGVSQNIFVATNSGLFISKDSGRSWNKAQELDREVVLNIDTALKSGSIIYLAVTSGIFKSIDNGKSWEKIYTSYSKENFNNQDGSEEIDAPEKTSDIRFVKAGNNNINLVYFSCAKGIYKSQDQGGHWEKLNDYGLLNRDVKMLCLSENSQLFALSQSGVFVLEDSHWTEVSFGLGSNKFLYLAFDNKSNIYVACEKGLFRANINNLSNFVRQGILQEYLKYEPKIRDVQEAAIKYAEVSPEKISQWRKKAAKKALLPQVSVGVDRNSGDLWHWESGSTTRVDDDVLRKGKDTVDWDISLAWNFGELIWNDDQTSIDVRSKLMVELRDDILDQVNKIYFERIRVKSELNNLSIEDRNKRFEKQLKLEELTASLDALTAGYYSKELYRLSPT